VAAKKNLARVVSSKIGFRSKVFSVRHETIVEPGGLKVTRDVVLHPGSVVVLPVSRWPDIDDSAVSARRETIFVGIGRGA
jgi:ADP-ribose pyrophosphatase